MSFDRAIDEYMAKHDIEEGNGSVLSVSRVDPHPSRLGHEIYSDEIFKSLENSETPEKMRSNGAR